MAAGGKKSPIWEFFSVVEDSRIAKCKKCNMEVPRGGQSTKTFTPTNLVHHLKTKPGHEEEYERYNKLKTEEKKKQSSTTDGTQLRQVSLQETAELLKVWDINDSRAKRTHTKVGEMIAIDCQPISVVDNEGFKSLKPSLSTIEIGAAATSVPSIRVAFSQAGIVYEEHRNRILPENAERLLFIKGNYARFGKHK